MNLLIDTNIFLEILLGQAKSREARSLLNKTEEHHFNISDFTFHSIGIVLFNHGRHNAFQQFASDIISNMGIEVRSLTSSETDLIVDASIQFHLDFDDAYQYVVAEKFNLIIVSFDSDFDRSDKGRRIPASFLG